MSQQKRKKENNKQQPLTREGRSLHRLPQPPVGFLDEIKSARRLPPAPRQQPKRRWALDGFSVSALISRQKKRKTKTTPKQRRLEGWLNGWFKAWMVGYQQAEQSKLVGLNGHQENETHVGGHILMIPPKNTCNGIGEVPFLHLLYALVPLEYWPIRFSDSPYWACTKGTLG